MTTPDQEPEPTLVQSVTWVSPNGIRTTITAIPEDRWEEYQEEQACRRRANAQRNGQLLHTVQFPSGRTSDQPEEFQHPTVADEGSNQEES